MSKQRQNRLLIFGLVVFGLGIYQLRTIWTPRSSLTPLLGTIRSANIYITTVTDRGYPGIFRAFTKHKSQVSELIFYLNEHNKKFSLVENIGDSYSNEEYRRILTGLRKADTVTVWIKNSEMGEYMPKVFQIDRDNQTTLLEFERTRLGERPLTLFLLVLGLSSVGLFLWHRYPERFRKFFA